MNKNFEANDNTAQDKSGDNPERRHVQGKALQMNDNSAEGKKPAKPPAVSEAGDKPNPQNVQGKGLQVNDNSAGG